MQKFERHHTLPLSIMGEDHSSNIVKIQKDIHKHIHRVLNLPSNDIREFRKKTNGIYVWTPQELDKKHDIRQRYLNGLDTLDKGTIKAHESSFGRQALRKQKWLHRLSGEKGLTIPPAIIKPKDFADSSEKKETLHSIANEKFEILCELEKDISEILTNSMFRDS